MELLQNLFIIGEFSPIHGTVLVTGIVLFFTVLVFWVTLILNCLIGNAIIDNLDKKRDKYEDIIIGMKDIKDIPVLQKKDIPVFTGVLIKYKELIQDHDFVREVFKRSNILDYYHRMTKSVRWKSRVRAVRVLGEIGYSDFFYWIKPLVHDRSAFVRDEALLALSKLASHSADKYVMDHVNFNYDGNIRWIDLILQNIARKESLVFIPYLETSNLALKHKMLDTIRYMHLIEYLPRIMELFDRPDNDEETEIKCIFIMALFPAPETKKFLMDKLNSSILSSAQLRKFIAMALYKIDIKLNAPQPGSGMEV